MNRHQFHRRVWGSVFGLALVLLWLGSALYDVQVVQGPSLAARANHKIQETETVEAARGQILDRYGRVLVSNRVVYQVMGDLTARLGQEDIGKFGYSRAGAVVGATYPSDLRALRKRLEHTFFLVPGYGAQGGTAEDVQYAFDKYGRGAIVNASRSIMCAWQKTGKDGADYQEAARAAAEKMRDEIKQYVTIL